MAGSKTRFSGLLESDKFSGRHTTLIEPAKKMVEFLRDDPRIKRVVIGKIFPKAGGHPGFKAAEVPAGVRVVVKSSQGAQELFFYAHSGQRAELCALLDVIRELDPAMVLR